MINIQEKPSIKNIGKTSLFVGFDYKPEYVRIVKSADNAVYDKNTHLWELPLNKLSYLIEEFTYLDDITISLWEESEENKLNRTLNYKTPPFDYQNEGIEWLINRNSGLLCDPPGLGKTLQVIYAAEELKAQKGIEHCLIICGINTLKQNWKKEIQRHSSEECVIIGEKINSKGTINYASIKDRAEQLYQPIKEFFIIINVEMLIDNIIIDAIKNSSNNYDMIVLDECHKCKGSQTLRGKNLLKLAKLGKYHFGLTGTLLINSPLDSYTPLKFIGEEKSTLTNFKNFYCVFEKQFGHNQITGFKNMDILKEEISNCSLRRSKDLLKLPPKIIVPEYLELTDKQYKFYSDIQSGVVEEADRVNIKTTSLLGLVTRLRQAVNCPSVLSSSDLGNIKLDRTLELIEEITSNEEKVVIFSTFKEPLYKLKEVLPNALLCTGDQTDEEISDSIDKFQTEDNCNIILCTSSKMGTGITLTAASYEIFLDSNWTASLEEQCEDRCHRIGTDKSVIIYKLIAKNTIDERIQNILERKRGISDYIIDNKLNEDAELKELLGIN